MSRLMRPRRLQIALACLALCGLSSAARADVDFAANSGLTAAQQQRIIDAHNQAIAKVDQALAYLRGTSAYSITGQNPSYNGLTQIFDRSAANPVLNSRAFQNQMTADYDLVRQKPAGFGTVVSAQSNQLAITQGTFTFDPTPIDDGTVRLGNRVYITPSSELYADGFRTDTLIDLGNLSFGPFTVNGVTIRTITTTTTVGGVTTTSTRDELVNTRFAIPPFTSGPIVPGTSVFAEFPAPEFAVLRPVIGETESLNAERYARLIDLMLDVRDALVNNTTTYSGNLEANRVTIINALSATGYLEDRGFEQYGFSTSGSDLYLQRQAQIAAGLAVDPLMWYEDTGTRVDGPDAGTAITIADPLAPGALNTFFEEKFTNLLSAGTMFVGKSALSGFETKNDDLYDSSNQEGNFQATDSLADLILQSFLNAVSGGDSSYNRTEINTANGSPNRDVVGGEFLTGDLDVNKVTGFFSNTAPISQGGIGTAAAGFTPGKIGIVGGAFQADFSDNIVVPFN